MSRDIMTEPTTTGGESPEEGITLLHVYESDDCVGSVAILEDSRGVFFRWRHPIAGSIVEGMRYDQAIRLRDMITRLDQEYKAR